MEYNIKNVTYIMCEGVHWIQMAQKRVQQLALVNRVMNIAAAMFWVDEA